MTEKTLVRGRFAPSPTGFVHIGSLRVALYNYLFVKQHQGSVLLRIEDTDRKRFISGSIENLLSVFKSLGIEHDEGPFLQSERLDLYRQYARQLVKQGKAYYCFCSAERLETMRKEQSDKKQMPKYDRHCLTLSPEEIQKNLEAALPDTTIRFRLPDNETVIANDLVRGEVSFDTRSMSDAVLLKSDGYPTYHLAMAVDDHLMRITHVIRGEEWLSSLPLHLLLYRAFGWEAPQFAHLPLILNTDKSKLSKRQGDVSVESYLQKGYLKEALLNFVALLGWNPGEGSTQEIFSLSELIERFDLNRVHKAGAVFDIKKLDWMNAQYIKRLSLDDLYRRTLPFLEQKDFYKHAFSEKHEESFVKKVLAIEQERLSRLDEAGESCKFGFVETLEYDKELLQWKDNSEQMTVSSLQKALETLLALNESDWSQERLSEILLRVAGEKRGDFLWPLRVALTGVKQSPSPFDVAWILGKDASVDRVRFALKKLT